MIMICWWLTSFKKSQSSSCLRLFRLQWITGWCTVYSLMIVMCLYLNFWMESRPSRWHGIISTRPMGHQSMMPGISAPWSPPLPATRLARHSTTIPIPVGGGPTWRRLHVVFSGWTFPSFPGLPPDVTSISLIQARCSDLIRSQLRWFWHLSMMPPGCLPLEIFQERPTGERTPQGLHVPPCLGTPQDRPVGFRTTQEFGEKDVFASPATTATRPRISWRKWMDGIGTPH